MAWGHVKIGGVFGYESVDSIKAGKLKGIAEEGQLGETRITASSAELAAWLRAADQKRLFDKPLVFQRVPR
jgi:hypothetical protein